MPPTTDSDSSLFDIMGPAMIGPSSSHTAGAVRLGLMARQLLGAHVRLTQVKFTLYNSFAQTYKGHGTDRGLVAGLLGIQVNDPQIRSILKEIQHNVAYQGLTVTFHPSQERNGYPPNTVRFEMEGVAPNDEHRQVTVVGYSSGGGKIKITEVQGFPVSLLGDQQAFVLIYKDQPGMIWQVTKIIAEHQVNIATLQCSRRQRGVEAFMTITLDSALPHDAIEQIHTISGVFWSRHLYEIL